MKNLFLTVMLFTGNLLVYSQFTCDSSMYLGQAPNAATNTTLYNVNTFTNPFTYPAIGTIASIKYNAMGFHPTTGYLYAIADASNNILRINSDGTFTNLGAVTNLPTGISFNSGEIDSAGNFYVSGAGSVNTLYRINIATLTATPIPLLSSLTVSDFAYNPVDGFLYGVHNTTGLLTRINTTTGVVTSIGTAIAGTPFGAMMGSSTGAIFGVSNNGGFYQFNITNGTRVLVSGAPASLGNDGAHCVTAPITFATDLSITKTNGTTQYTAGTSTTYTIVVRNNGSFGVLNASVTDSVPAGIPNANMTYTAVASAGSTTAVTGTQTGAINDLVSLPVNGTVTYTVTVNIPAAFTGNLTNTAIITSPVTSTDSNLANNSATDTDVSSCSAGLDSDGDGISNFCDLDADNDGIPNCVENGFNGDPNTTFKSNGNATALTNSSGIAPTNQFRLTNGASQVGQAWSYGKIDFAQSFNINMKVLLSDADGIAIVFQNDPLGTSAAGIVGQGLGARGISNGIALELDTFENSCDNDLNNGGNCDPSFDHGSIRMTAGTATTGWTKLAGDGQLGDGTVNDGLWHTVNVIWNATTRNLSYTFDGMAVTNYTFPATGANSLTTIFGGTTNVRFGFTGSTGEFGSNNSIGFDNPCSIPVYFDTDNDGTPDYLDLDSDNDGCPDAREGGDNVTASQLNPNGSINTGATGGVNANGIPNLVNVGGAADIDNAAGQSIGFAQQSSINECNDIDNDGIADLYDLDNDNDGILDSDECGSTNRVSNGVFPTTGGNTNTVTGWTVGGTYSAIWPSGTGRVNLNSNGLEFRRDQSTTTTLSQNLTGMMPAALITLNNLYWYRSPGIETENGFTFTVSYAGTVYATISSTGTAAPVVTANNGATVSISTLPSVASTDQISAKTNLTIKLPFTAGLPASGQLLLTFVAGISPDHTRDLGMGSVTVFACQDTDGDGIANIFDIDSDNDGCPDAVEGDENVTATQLNPDGSINVAANGGVNTFGVSVLVNTGGSADIGSDQGQGVGYSQISATNACTDTDNDGIADVLDLDKDNDGILDTDECGGAGNIIKRGNFTTLPATPGTFTPAQFVTANPDWVLASTGAGAATQIFWGNTTSPFAFGNGIRFQSDAVTQSLTQSVTNLYHYAKPQVVISRFAASNSNPLANSSTLILSYAGVEYMRIATANGVNTTSTLTYSNGASGSLATVAVGTVYNNWVIDLPYGVPSTGSLKIDYLAGPADSDDFYIGDIVINACQDTDTDGIPNFLDLDSDNDGCLDAIEGGDNVTSVQLVAAASGLGVGTGSSASNQNLCAGTGCVDAQGVPTVVNSGGAADITGDQGQGAGFSQTTLFNECDTTSGFDCIKPGVAGTPLPTKVGILTKSNPSTLWPQNVPNGHIVLDGAEKGFVITHMTTAERDALVPVEGMMIYNTTVNCVQLYRGTTPSVDSGRTGWNCLETACDGIPQRNVNIGYWEPSGYNFFSNHGTFRNQLQATTNYGPTGTFKGVSGWTWIDANTDVNATAATFTAAQMKAKYDMIVTGYNNMTAASAAKIKEYTDLGGVVFVLADGLQSAGNALNTAFGGTGNISNGSDAQAGGNAQARTLNNSISNGIFGTGGGVTITGANGQAVPPVANIPAGSFITAYMNFPTVTSTTNAGVYITGASGRAIFVYDEGIYRAGSVGGTAIDTTQEIFIHNLMSYALQKVGFSAQ
ncbi:hypothetical protein BA768_03235 [Chryseobacterium sp. CBo1]|uniref:DUF6923 family protein n=1 Tax=Chryseobacterium sp. CBo1 TaxID=1869230 RepID=UPI0008105526|nr:DUF11 domain-containing protein [Chryseobacterium sp. CBo1]OCK51737.1 hypothetical protein BA768_03235 [Chryseobacterium sp. CBo1]